MHPLLPPLQTGLTYTLDLGDNIEHAVIARHAVANTVIVETLDGAWLFPMDGVPRVTSRG